MGEKIERNLTLIDSKIYHLSPSRFELRKGTAQGAPLCPYGNNYSWIGYDKKERKYVRFTKSVFKKLIKEIGD